MSNETENQDSNPEGEQDTNLENESNEELDKSKEYGENQKIRAEKAEKKVKELEAKPSEPEEKETPTKPTEESSEPNYGLEGFLEGRKVVHPDDKQMVKDEMSRLKLPASDILGMEHIVTKLKNAKDQRTATEGMPKGGNRGKSATKNDVDYYLNKPQKADGTFETPQDVELANKVIEARMYKEEQGNKFSEEMFTG